MVKHAGVVDDLCCTVDAKSSDSEICWNHRGCELAFRLDPQFWVSGFDPCVHNRTRWWL